jgi:hypothetical protein
MYHGDHAHGCCLQLLDHCALLVHLEAANGRQHSRRNKSSAAAASVQPYPPSLHSLPLITQPQCVRGCSICLSSTTAAPQACAGAAQSIAVAAYATQTACLGQLALLHGLHCYVQPVSSGWLLHRSNGSQHCCSCTAFAVAVTAPASPVCCYTCCWTL